jgi:xanthosine utilization system XapX-like protein
MAKPPPAKVVQIAEKARNGLRSLERKLAPPELGLLGFVSDLWGFQIVYTLAELQVVDALKGGPRRAEAVATEIGVDSDHLYRLLRAATHFDIVREEPDRSFSLLPMGVALCDVENESFRDFLILEGRVGWRFWGRLKDSVRQGKTAIEIETGKKPFEYLVGDENARHVFNRAMTAISAVSAEAFVAAYDLSGFRHIVDVGGGLGRLLSAMLVQAPLAKGVLFDLPEVVADAPPVLEALGTKSRVEIVGGSFFESVPAGAELYVMKSIIHDWADDEALKILENVRRAATPSSKLVLYETVVTPPNVKHFAKLLDIEMIVHAGGRERTRDEYAELFRKAGFRLSRLIPSAGPASVIEALPA